MVSTLSRDAGGLRDVCLFGVVGMRKRVLLVVGVGGGDNAAAAWVYEAWRAQGCLLPGCASCSRTC